MHISEKDIAKTCTQWLELDGWRAFSTEVVAHRAWGKGAGELGQPDYLYIRYDPWLDVPPSKRGNADAEVLRIEWKKPGGKNAPHQKAWRERERARGALVWASMEDFAPTIEAFQAFYRASGLMRRKI